MARKPLILPVSEWAPDMPTYMADTSAVIDGVIPRTPRSYGPVYQPAPLTAALGARCQGAMSGFDSAGTINAFAGDAANLYQWTAANTTSWTNVSKSAAAYTISAEEQWRFALYGQRVIATNINDPVQSFTLGSSTKFSDLIVTANPPKARHGATVKTFFVLANTTDPTYGAQPQRVWWSRNGNPTSFDDPGTQGQLAAQYQTSYQDLLGEGGAIQGIVGNLGTADGAIFQRYAIFRMVWTGGPSVFDFFPAQGVRGCAIPGSIAQLGSVVYYVGDDLCFYVFDGTSSRGIGVNKVDRTFAADLDQQYLGSVSSCVDPVNKLYIIFYPGAGHTGANANKMLMYNWQIDRWSPAMPIAAGGEYIMRALSFGYTLDQLTTVLGYTDIDTVPFSLDSAVWTGGSLNVGIFDTTHKLNFFTGNPIAATVELNEIQPVAGQTLRIWNTRPILDGPADASVTLGTRNRQNDAVTYGSAVPMTSLGTAPQRALGRYVRAQITRPASSSSWTHISGVELEGAPAGARN